MANPLVAQGTLNRLKASAVWDSFPSLNVTPPYLGKGGISLSLEGEAAANIGTMTGTVQSPEPYMMVSLTINLLKTQSLSDQYKSQMELNALLGGVTVRPDATTLGVYYLQNMAIESVRELNFAGQDAGYVVTCKGYYSINSSLFN